MSEQESPRAPGRERKDGGFGMAVNLSETKKEAGKLT